MGLHGPIEQFYAVVVGNGSAGVGQDTLLALAIVFTDCFKRVLQASLRNPKCRRIMLIG